MGYEGISNWQGWDNVIGYLPQAEMQSLIVELRSLTLGVGYFYWKYDHLQEVPEKLALTHNCLQQWQWWLATVINNRE